MDEVTVYNMALSAVGTRSSISSPDENSREAEICRLWFPSVRDKVLRAAPWPSAKATRRLSVLAERDANEDWVATDPDPAYVFAYSAPSDMLRPRHLSNFGQFEVGRYSGHRAIMANTEKAILIYTMRQDNIAAWDSSLQMAIVHALAAEIALPLHGKPDRAALALERAQIEIMEAREQAGNSDMRGYESVPPWMSARGYAEAQPSSRYVYPNGPMVFVAGLNNVRSTN